MVRSALAVLALVAIPVAASAQDPTTPESRTHTVVAGNTLWNLAMQFYGSGFDWSRIYEANREQISDPDLLEPGQVLRIPGAQPAVVGAVMVSAVEAPTVGAQGAEAAEAAAGVDQVEVAAASTEEMAGDDPPAVAEAAPMPPPTSARRPGPMASTLFEPHAATEMTRAQEEAMLPTAFSPDDLYRAAWLVPVDGEPARVGRIDHLVGAEQVRVARQSARPFDLVQIMVEGNAPGVGTRLQSFRMARTLAGVGQVVSPTGTLTVVERSGNGVIARVDGIYDLLVLGDMIREAPAFTLRPGVTARPVQGALEVEIVGFAEGHEMESIGDYVFLGAGSDTGVGVGDLFDVVWQGRVDWGDGPEGTLQVVRVSNDHSTARIVHLKNPVFRTGVVVRLSGRMQ